MARDLDEPLTTNEIADARRRISGRAVRAPLVAASGGRTWLKLECLQPTGSYKIRGATNALRAARERGEDLLGIVSASAGNFGQAIVAAANALAIPVVIHVPDQAARVKVDNLRLMGATVHEHGFEDWWRIMESRATGDAGTFFHPVCEREVIAGSATIGEEIIEDLPEVGAVLIPIGGGGLACGIAQAVKRHRPRCRVIGVEAETAMPLRAALAAGRPVAVERVPSFVDGMGSGRILDAMWPLLRRLVDEVVVVSLAEVEGAIWRLAAEHHVIAEGAGAAAFAAAAKVEARAVVAIVSGGNIDAGELCRILDGQSVGESAGGTNR